MKRILPVLLLVTILGGVAACKKNNNSRIPVITFVSLAPDSMRGGSSFDTSYLKFTFKDGDADLGNDPTQGKYDVFLHDIRDTANEVTFRYIFPDIPDAARDPLEGLKGEGEIKLQAALIKVRQDSLHMTSWDTAQYEMWVIDQADNKSNVILTTPLYIRGK